MPEKSAPPLSEAVKLAWRLAAEEAVHAGQPQIEPIHLLLGVCGVERVIRDEGWDRYSVSMSRKDTVNSEWNELRSAATMAGLEITPLACYASWWTWK